MATDKKKKKPSKFKKIVKNLLKAATLGTLGYGAAKMFGGRRGTGGFLKSGAAGGASLKDPAMPLHLGEGFARPYQDDIMRGGEGSAGWTDERPWYKKIFKKGGRVGVGIAKRGFGRALKK